MEQSVRLSKNQLRNLRRKAEKEMLKIQHKKEDSSSSSEGKVMVGPIDIQESKNEADKKLQGQLDQMKKLIQKYEETVYNQGGKIRELMNGIDDQNNELLILRRQLIQNNLVAELQLYEQSQSIVSQQQKMIIEKEQIKLTDQYLKQEEKIDINLQMRIEKLEKKVFRRRFKKNRPKTADTVRRIITFYDNAELERNSKQEKNEEHEETLINSEQRMMEFINRKFQRELKIAISGNLPRIKKGRGIHPHKKMAAGTWLKAQGEQKLQTIKYILLLLLLSKQQVYQRQINKYSYLKQASTQ